MSPELKVNDYTPSRPENLQVSFHTRRDDRGQLHPVLLANWTIQDDGSIRFLKATELHVLKKSNNGNVCIRYSLKNVLSMRSPSGEKWSFSSDMLVLDPGQSYKVSIFNIPKPEILHSDYDVSADVIIPDCNNLNIKKTQYCIEIGSLWQANLSMALHTDSSLAINFNPDTLSEKYLVIARCDSISKNRLVYKIIPYFPQCENDCPRRKTTQNICRDVLKENKDQDLSFTLFAVGLVLVCTVIAVSMCVFCRKQEKPTTSPLAGIDGKLRQQPLKPPPNVLVIYSQDHPLYRDIVLKLCAFLQAKCGTNVLVDLLDSTSVSMVGRLRWLEWQRQQLKDPSDKILVLCSRGVQAKWMAMCGQGQVRLKEDIRSPTDDILIPFLNIFLPDLHQAGRLGKYMVAYFEEISTEKDVPSVFDITVKYSLMKNFEELFFRILDLEKYQPGQVNHIEGIGADEYFNCPSGRALKNAIEKFRAHQVENPDWFEKECEPNEEEVEIEADHLTDQLQIPPVLECVPLIRDGSPVYIHDVHVNENYYSGHIMTPELNPEHHLSSVAERLPVVNSDYKHQYLSSNERVLTDHLLSHSQELESVYIVEPVLNNQPFYSQSILLPMENPLTQIPTEDDEEDSLLPMSHHTAHSDQAYLAPQNSLDSSASDSVHLVTQSKHFPSPEMSLFPSEGLEEELEEEVDLEPIGNVASQGSDQGYNSTMSSQHEASQEDPKVALAKFQEWLCQQNFGYFDINLEEESHDIQD
ncbi:unnamed protein product [Menidia menidia]|uniref:(Atlantic silverside) hypothetical protein n=1 Tax=Menidia menidia TaxID=238744 RepID=A0A8S4B805_9TELE|nr:unnamed protein product [Menidia menidia]